MSVFAGSRAELRASYGEERWRSRRARNVPSLINDDAPWRVNPLADEGVLHLFTLSGTFDTRNSAQDPRTGWYLRGDYERGDGTLVAGPFVERATRPSAPRGGATTYARALFDLRRYNRLGPNASLNVRAVVGGWLSGDA